MKNWLIKTAINLMGGVEGLVEFVLDWFNANVLAKIKDAEEFAAYASDVECFAEYLDGVFNRHQKWMSEARRSALVATINAVREMAMSLKDCKVEKSELDAIVDKVVAAIKAWKDAK